MSLEKQKVKRKVKEEETAKEEVKVEVAKKTHKTLEKISAGAGFIFALPTGYIFRLTGLRVSGQLNMASNLGFMDYIHEAGHLFWAKSLFQDPQDANSWVAASDCFNNFRASPSLQTFTSLVTGACKGAEAAYYGVLGSTIQGSSDLSSLGKTLGETASNAIYFLGGSLAELGTNFLVFEVGRRLYKRFPAVGVGLQSFALASHLNSSSPGREGADWDSFGYLFNNNTPQPISGIFGALYATSLFAYAAMTHRQEIKSALRNGMEYGTKLVDSLKPIIRKETLSSALHRMVRS